MTRHAPSVSPSLKEEGGLDGEIITVTVDAAVLKVFLCIREVLQFQLHGLKD